MTVARGPPGRPSSSSLLGCWRRRPPLGFGAKVGIAIALGLSFAVIWTLLSWTSTSQQISTERSSFAADVAAPPPPPASHNRTSSTTSGGGGHTPHKKPRPAPRSHKKRHPASPSKSHSHRSNGTAAPDAAAAKADHAEQAPVIEQEPKEKEPELESEAEPEQDMEMEPEKEAELPMPEENGDNGGKAPSEEEEEKAPQLELEEESNEGDFEEDPEAAKRKAAAKKRKLPPLFSSSAHYHWKQCSAKSGHHYVPCVDFDGDGGQRHHERSCPRLPVTCLVSLPKEYKSPAPWPERRDKVWYENVGHPRLSSYVKGHNWLNHTGEYLMFPPDEWEFKGGARHYVESIDQTAPDIDWGKNIRIILDIGCRSAGFGVALLEKDVITLSLGLTNDQTGLAQVALERGIAAIVGSLGSRRLPFPSGAFDAIHCGECSIPWHSNVGKLLEMNRILRPGGYFIISSKSTDLESEEGISASMTAVCWNSIAYNSDDVSEAGVKIFQRPATNEIYDMRAKKDPPFCKEDQNKATAWYTHIKHCLHKAPVGIEERGSDWPEEWPKRLETFPEWLGDSETRVSADHNHWKAVVEKSYLDGLGIDWTNIRNVMDMRAVYGGFAAALASKKVWVMNVVPMHAADTLPIVYERGLIGIYHDWCEPFSTYPRSYDLLHADHLFSCLKMRCKQPVAIVVEMDRILRPGGWAIIRDKLEILDPLEAILKSLQWEIVMTFRKDKEGIMSVKKTMWRP